MKNWKLINKSFKKNSLFREFFEKEKIGTIGFEPMTSSISESCSDQLSYMPIFLDIPMGFAPMKKSFADSPNNYSGKGWWWV